MRSPMAHVVAMPATRLRPRSRPTDAERTTATGEPRVVGPGFHAKVYEVVRRVPRGKVTTYGDVATMLGSPRVARQVGYALAALDPRRLDKALDPRRLDKALEKSCGAVVPWHRVINAQGAVSFKGDVVRGTMQRKLLENEGVHFDEHERCDLASLRFDYGKRRRK